MQKFVFVSNYLNHHQIPFCDAMYEKLGGDFVFIQTEPMEKERVQMGWQEDVKVPYLKLYYEEPQLCSRLTEDCAVLLFGGTDDESYVKPRLEAGKPVIRYSERIYKTGQWKAVSPRGLLQKYKDHTKYRKKPVYMLCSGAGKPVIRYSERIYKTGQWKAVSPRGLLQKYKDHTKYRKKPVYMLCSGAYVPSDFRIVRAYPGKLLRWGYFPETRLYDKEKLMSRKEPASIFWAARFIDWKHPELPLQTAAFLKEKGCSFHLYMAGGGEKEPEVKRLLEEYGLQEEVTLLGYQTPEQVRQRMEKSDIYLVTSDRQEGWGAVVNEAMNSGCAVVANHMIGAVPFLIKHGKNGLIYQDGRKEALFRLTCQLLQDRDYCRRLGEAALDTITKEWNAENAAERLCGLCDASWLSDAGAGETAYGEIRYLSGNQ